MQAHSRHARRTLPLLGAASILLATLLAIALPGCGDAPVRPENVALPGEVLVWPRPPAPARLRFVRNVASPADWGVSRGALQGLVDAFTGQSTLRFVRPTGVAERGGALFVADPGAQALLIFDNVGARELKLDRVGSDRLVSPVALALGPGETVFVADSGLGKVFAVDRQGRPQNTIRHGRMQRPAGLAYDAIDDRLYVADSATHRILVFTASGQLVEAFGGNGAAPGRFNFPTHLALTRDRDLVVTDTLNFRIQILDGAGRPIAMFGRVGDGSGDFASPKGVASDSKGSLYVVDALFDAVQVFTREGTLLMGFGERGTRPGQFWLPNGLYIDPQDRVYVADSYNQRIVIFEQVRSNPGTGAK